MKITPGQARILRGAARAATANLEPLTGAVTDIDAAGRITVEVDGIGEMVVPNASGQTVLVGDQVSLRTYGRNVNTMEIAGKTARTATTNILTVWR